MFRFKNERQREVVRFLAVDLIKMRSKLQLFEINDVSLQIETVVVETVVVI